MLAQELGVGRRARGRGACRRRAGDGPPQTAQLALLEPACAPARTAVYKHESPRALTDRCELDSLLLSLVPRPHLSCALARLHGIARSTMRLRLLLRWLGRARPSVHGRRAKLAAPSSSSSARRPCARFPGSREPARGPGARPACRYRYLLERGQASAAGPALCRPRPARSRSAAKLSRRRACAAVYRLALQHSIARALTETTARALYALCSSLLCAVLAAPRAAHEHPPLRLLPRPRSWTGRPSREIEAWAHPARCWRHRGSSPPCLRPKRRRATGRRTAACSGTLGRAAACLSIVTCASRSSLHAALAPAALQLGVRPAFSPRHGPGAAANLCGRLPDAQSSGVGGDSIEPSSERERRT